MKHVQRSLSGASTVSASAPKAIDPSVIDDMPASLDPSFVTLADKLLNTLIFASEQCRSFDLSHPDRGDRIAFVQQYLAAFFHDLDQIFMLVWDIAKDLPESVQEQYQQYYQSALYDYLVAPSEINSYIYAKPLGYAGDFVMMNYIFDYQSEVFLGESSYSMLINKYICSIPVSQSNIQRKNVIKNAIIRTISESAGKHVVSIGSGSARELLEILRSEIEYPFFEYTAVDFEPAAIEYLRKEIADIKCAERKCKINYVHFNIKDLIRNNGECGRIKSSDFIYVSGVYDYFSSIIAARTIRILFSKVKNGGKFTFFNISTDHEHFRSMYELCGEWRMYHRNELEAISLIKQIPESSFDAQLSKCGTYWQMDIRKK